MISRLLMEGVIRTGRRRLTSDKGVSQQLWLLRLNVLYCVSEVLVGFAALCEGRLVLDNRSFDIEGRTLASCESLTVAGASILLRLPSRGRVPAPLIVLLYGFGPPSSEQALADALPLDGLHAYKAYLGLPLFGARMPSAGMIEVRRRQAEDFVLNLFLPVAEDVLHELPAVIDSLGALFPIQLDPGVGLFGVSASGGITLLALLESQVPIAAVVVCNTAKNLATAVATTERVMKFSYPWTDTARTAAHRIDPVRRAAEIAKREPPPAILLLHSQHDEYFRVEDTRELYDALRSAYQEVGIENRLSFSVVPDTTHHFAAQADTGGQVPIADAAPIRKATAEWFGKYLAA